MKRFYEEFNNDIDKNKFNGTIEYYDLNDYLKFKKSLSDTVYMYHSWDRDIHQEYKSNKQINCVYIQDNPYFIASVEQLENFKPSKKYTLKKYYSYVKSICDIQDLPSYDEQNRNKMTEDIITQHFNPEKIKLYNPDEKLLKECITECIKICKKGYISGNATEITVLKMFPSTTSEAKDALNRFIRYRLQHFGDYQDYIDEKLIIAFHSGLSPMINNGLLPVKYVLNELMKKRNDKNIQINNWEGYIRQLVGWREYMILLYWQDTSYQKMTTENYFNNDILLKPKRNPVPTTGLTIFDHEIQKAYIYGYSHHIIRLMVLGNIMNLIRIESQSSNYFFMGAYLDSYDWVMVGNLTMAFYNSDIMSRKVYIGSSNYYKNMGRYTGLDDEQQTKTIDALFYRFLIDNEEKFKKRSQFYLRNIATYKKFDNDKKKEIKTLSDKILNNIKT